MQVLSINQTLVPDNPLEANIADFGIGPGRRQKKAACIFLWWLDHRTFYEIRNRSQPAEGRISFRQALLGISGRTRSSCRKLPMNLVGH